MAPWHLTSHGRVMVRWRTEDSLEHLALWLVGPTNGGNPDAIVHENIIVIIQIHINAIEHPRLGINVALLGK